MNAPGISIISRLNMLLKSVGLSYAEVQTVDGAFPDHPVALNNRSVEATASVEPSSAIVVQNGDATVIQSDDKILPNHQIAVLVYSHDFVVKQARRRDPFHARLWSCGAVLQWRPGERSARQPQS